MSPRRLQLETFKGGLGPRDQRTASSSCTYLGQALATNHVPGTSLDRKESANQARKVRPTSDRHHPSPPPAQGRPGTPASLPPGGARAPPRRGRSRPRRLCRLVRSGTSPWGETRATSGAGPRTAGRLASARPLPLTAPSPRGPHTPGVRDRLGPQPPGEDPQQGCPTERPKDPAGAAQASYRSAWWPGSALEDRVTPDLNSGWAGVRTAPDLGSA